MIQIFIGITLFRGTILVGPNNIEQETSTQQTNSTCRIIFVSTNVGVTALEGV